MNRTFLVYLSAAVLFALVDTASSKICMGELGCIENTREWYLDGVRERNALPKSREEIQATFVHFYEKSEYIIKPTKDSILQSKFNSSQPTMIIIHGFLDNRKYGEWIEHMVELILKHYDRNVIFLDWSKGNWGWTYVGYQQVCANARVVGAELGLFLARLKEHGGLRYEDVHLIGHSLGAHIAGYASKWLNTKVGRITGLDPSKPEFEGMPPAVRLDRSDADFVDVIHTDIEGLGMKPPIGHADFYPNGSVKQPGCTIWTPLAWKLLSIYERIRLFASCSHQRSITYFEDIEYSKRYCTSYAVRCSSYADFLAGNCDDCGPDGSRCAIMGMRAIESKRFQNPNASNVYFLKTRNDRSFCEMQYRVTMYFGRQVFRHKHQMAVTLYAGKRHNGFRIFYDAEKIWPNCVKQRLISTGFHLGDPLTAIDLRWQISGFWSDIFRSATPIEILKVEVQPIFPPTDSPSSYKLQTFCNKYRLPAKQTIFYNPC